MGLSLELSKICYPGLFKSQPDLGSTFPTFPSRQQLCWTSVLVVPPWLYSLVAVALPDLSIARTLSKHDSYPMAALFASALGERLASSGRPDVDIRVQIARALMLALRVRIYACVCMCLSACTYECLSCVHVYICACVHLCICTSVHVCMCARVYTHACVRA